MYSITTRDKTDSGKNSISYFLYVENKENYKLNLTTWPKQMSYLKLCGYFITLFYFVYLKKFYPSYDFVDNIFNLLS